MTRGSAGNHFQENPLLQATKRRNSETVKNNEQRHEKWSEWRLEENDDDGMTHKTETDQFNKNILPAATTENRNNRK